VGTWTEQVMADMLCKIAGALIVLATSTQCSNTSTNSKINTSTAPIANDDFITSSGARAESRSHTSAGASSGTDAGANSRTDVHSKVAAGAGAEPKFNASTSAPSHGEPGAHPKTSPVPSSKAPANARPKTTEAPHNAKVSVNNEATAGVKATAGAKASADNKVATSAKISEATHNTSAKASVNKGVTAGVKATAGAKASADNKVATSAKISDVTHNTNAKVSVNNVATAGVKVTPGAKVSADNKMATSAKITAGTKASTSKVASDTATSAELNDIAVRKANLRTANKIKTFFREVRAAVHGFGTNIRNASASTARKIAATVRKANATPRVIANAPSRAPITAAPSTPSVIATPVPKANPTATPSTLSVVATPVPKANPTPAPSTHSVTAANIPPAAVTSKPTPATGAIPPHKPSNPLSANASIVFESYDVRRPEAAELPIGALREELYKLGYIATPHDVMNQLGSQLALPAMANPKLTAKGLLGELGSAHNQYAIATEFGKLASVLSRAVTEALDNPALVVTDQTIRDNLQNTLLELALVNGKLARDPAHAADAKRLQDASADMMAEWIRTFGGVEITQKRNGPEAEKLYMRVRNDYDKLGRGNLEVSVDDPNVQLYVNEEIRSSQRAMADLVPGRYRILLMGPNDDARVFKVDVRPNQTTHLHVQWAVSSNLVASASAVAFVFASPIHPEASALACKLAGAAGRGHDAIVLLGMEPAGKQWRVMASLYETRNCQLLREGYVVSVQSTTRGSSALARFIAQGIRAPEITVVTEAGPAVFEQMIRDRMAETAVPAKPKPAPEPTHELAWMALAGSAAMLAVGSYTVYSGPRGVGYGALGAGVALGALAVYSFSHDEKPEEASHVTIAPLRAGAAIGWSGRF
jgi:hypothetical protein